MARAFREVSESCVRKYSGCSSTTLGQLARAAGASYVVCKSAEVGGGREEAINACTKSRRTDFPSDDRRALRIKGKRRDTHITRKHRHTGRRNMHRLDHTFPRAHGACAHLRDPLDGGLLPARGTDRHQIVETAEELLSYPRPLRVCCCARRGARYGGRVSVRERHGRGVVWGYKVCERRDAWLGPET